MSEYEVALTLVLEIVIHGPVAETLRSMVNPDSFPELSRQLRVIWLEETPEAVRYDGATGTVGRAARSGVAKKKFRAPTRSISRREK